MAPNRLLKENRADTDTVITGGNTNMTDKPILDATGNPYCRRGLLRSGAIGGAAALCAAGGGSARAAAVAPPPVNDKDFPDFSLIKINSDDDSLAKIQKKGM